MRMRKIFYFVFEEFFWFYDVVKDVFFDVRVYSRQGVVQQVDVGVIVYSVCKVYLLFLFVVDVYFLLLIKLSIIIDI